MISIRTILVVLTVLMSCSACTNINVKPWQKGYLANKAMLIVSDPLESSIRGHTFSSKEAASGGYSVGAGGCGCN